MRVIVMEFIVSIDPGVKNFAVYKEACDVSKIRDLQNGKTYPDELLFKKICLEGRTVSYKVHSLIDKNASVNVPLSNEMRVGLFNILDNYKKEGFWDGVKYVIIEEQFINTRASKQYKGTANMIAIKIGEVAYSWILYHYPATIISYFPSRRKYAICRCPATTEKKSRKTGNMEPRKMTKVDRKKWAITKSHEILISRGENEVVDHLLKLKKTEKQKLDDIGDCIIQLQAFKWTI
jgi:hypothetical protein